jgi:hypothetical protein
MEAAVFYCLGIHPAIWSLVAFHGTEPLLGMKSIQLVGVMFLYVAAAVLENEPLSCSSLHRQS